MEGMAREREMEGMERRERERVRRERVSRERDESASRTPIPHTNGSGRRPAPLAIAPTDSPS